MDRSRLKFEALGTVWIIEPSTPKVKKIIKDFEAQYSRFNPNSELSQLNKMGYLNQPSNELVNMITFALDLYKNTNKLFDISIGGELTRAGYGRADSVVARKSKNLIKDLIVSNKKISLKNNIYLDLGGFGKGWLIDKIAKQIPGNFIINGGGDIAVGSKEKNIIITNPNKLKVKPTYVSLKNQAIASSAASARTWQKGDKRYSHIPNYNKLIASSHVISNNAATADALATTLLLTSRQEDQQKIIKHYKAKAMVVYRNRSTFLINDFPTRS